MVESCLEHISKLILIGKSMAIENTEAENLHFFKNRWKPSQKMRLDVVWWINNRNTEAKQKLTENHYFGRMAGNHLKRRALMR